MNSPIKWHGVELFLIPGFPGYSASQDGRIWSCWKLQSLGGQRGTRSFAGTEWRELHPTILPTGRKRYCLMKNNRRHTFYGYHLVLQVFVGTRPIGCEACHNNGDATDDRLENLRWDTHQANLRDKHKHGTHRNGEQHHGAKLTVEDVQSIRLALAVGCAQKHLAHKYGVTPATICDIKQRRTWNHV